MRIERYGIHTCIQFNNKEKVQKYVYRVNVRRPSVELSRSFSEMYKKDLMLAIVLANFLTRGDPEKLGIRKGMLLL